MTPSDIADWLEFRAGRKEGGDNAEVNRILHGLDRQAAATIRAQAEEVRALSDCRCELEAVSLALGSGVRFMDPPDGGSVTIAEQVVRMRIALHEAETKLKIATEALEEVRDGASEVALITIADQALARIKEVGA